MRYLCVFVLAFVSMFALSADAPRATHQFEGLSIGGLLGNETAMGCGCFFYYPPESAPRSSIVLSWAHVMEGQSPAKASIVVDGQLKQLAIVKPMQLPPRRSARVSCSMAGPDTRVEMSLTTTSVCDGTVPECDGSGYKGTMLVTHGKAMATIPISGGCGC
jgi:hypothetical protein